MTIKSVIGTTGLVVAEGERWKKLRKMFNPAFAPNHIETMMSDLVEECQVFVEKLQEVADTGRVVRMNDFTLVIFPFRTRTLIQST